MIESSDLRMTRIPLKHGAGQLPALGFGTLIPDAAVTITATRDALEAGFRHFDCAERYGNEREVGRALQAGLAAGGIAREYIFVTTKPGFIPQGRRTLKRNSSQVSPYQ